MTRSQKFWSKVKIVNDEDSCWEWQAGLNTNGYGQFNLCKDGKRLNMGAHRFSYELANGPIPKGILVCHKCDNPKCVRPKHLFPGTYQDNMDDMVRKKRHLISRNRDWLRKGLL